MEPNNNDGRSSVRQRTDFDGSAERLCNFYQQVSKSLGICKNSKSFVGFVDNAPKEMMGIITVKAPHQHKHGDGNGASAKLWASPYANPEFEKPIAFIKMPNYMKGFNVSLCLLTSADSAPTKKMLENLQKRATFDGTAAAVQMWFDRRAHWLNEKETAVAVQEAPLQFKRPIISTLLFPFFDASCEDYVSQDKESLLRMMEGARRNFYKIVFYIRKVDLDSDLIDKVAYLDSLGIKTLVVDYHWSQVSKLMDNIVSLDECALMPLTKETDVPSTLDWQKQIKSHSAGCVTRNATFSEEMAWTVPYLFSEGKIERAEFEAWLLAKLDCIVCHSTPRIHSKQEHMRTLRRQIRTICLHLRRQLHPFRELHWFDISSNNVVHTRPENVPSTHLAFFNSIGE